MKKALWIVLAASLVLGFAAVAGAADQAADVETAQVSLTDTGEYVPFWFDTTTHAICAPNGSTNPCTSDFDCQRYYDPTFICVNPTGGRCAGECIPC